MSLILQRWLNIEAEVLDTLRASRIHEFHASFVQRFEPGDRPADSDWTILVTTERKFEQDKEKWETAVELILNIDGVVASHIKIEIMLICTNLRNGSILAQAGISQNPRFFSHQPSQIRSAGVFETTMQPLLFKNSEKNMDGNVQHHRC